MSVDRVAALLAAWVRIYTRGLPGAVARRRQEELQADVHDHIAHGRAAGDADRRIARSIVWRMARGAVADLAWRGGQTKAARTAEAEASMQPTRAWQQSAARVLVAVALILCVPLVATLASDSWQWSVGDFVLAGALLAATGAVIELAVRRAGNSGLAMATAGVGVGAAVVGQLDDAPGLVVLGVALIAGGGALGWRSRQHSTR